MGSNEVPDDVLNEKSWHQLPEFIFFYSSTFVATMQLMYASEFGMVEQQLYKTP